MAHSIQVKKRKSYKRFKKMLSHLEEFESFFNQRMGALKNMIEAAIDDEYATKRKHDK